ncbi:hypothetical protein [Pseudomonas sp. KCJK8993]|uniref:hypothetical protein n=1 Tax=Pseudomonas sp. KCJK8993 TaxID=3344565 RepID=UPI0039059CFF
MASTTTLLVGANNSGKSSAMLALRKFLLSKATVFRLQDLTLSHLAVIDAIGADWEASDETLEPPTANEWSHWLPTLDLWVEASQGELHYIRDLIPNFAWKGGHVGMRFRLEPKDMAKLFTDYRKERTRVKMLQQEIAKQTEEGKTPPTLPLWPQSLHDYLNRRLGAMFTVCWYRLDPSKLDAPDTKTRHANLQPLSATAVPLGANPLTDLIRVHEINAQRGFGDSAEESVTEGRGGSGKRLTEQLRAYYNRHLDPGDSPDISDWSRAAALRKVWPSWSIPLSQRLPRQVSSVLAG